MKKIILAITITILSISSIYAQSWQNCNEMIITVDDFNTTLDFENQPADCGCSSKGECTLVRIKLVETINGVETPVNLFGIGFMPPLGSASEPNQISKDYIDLFDPYFNSINCTEYQAAGGLNHSYLISPVAPAGDEFHVLVCPGSEQGVRNGRFFSPPGVTTLTAPTNVNATDGNGQTDISFDAIPGKYYMAYRNSDNCNDAWVKIDGNSNWPQANSNTMTIRDQQGSTYGNQYEYRVVASDFAFDPATSAAGIWSEGDLGHGGTLIQAYDPNNGCSSSSSSSEDCGLDIRFSTDDCANLIIGYIPNYVPDRLGTGLLTLQPNCQNTWAPFSSMWNPDETFLTIPFSSTGLSDFVFFVTGTTDDGTVCNENNEHAYSIKPNGVVIPIYLDPFIVTNANGLNVDFDPPIIMDCPVIAGVESSHQPGDFFPCGCTEVIHTIIYSDGTTVEYIQPIEVGCQSDCDGDTEHPTCNNNELVFQADLNSNSVTVDFTEYFSDNCDTDLLIQGFNITSSVSVSAIVDLICGETYELDMSAVDDNSNSINCTFTVTVDCADDPMEPDTCIVEDPFSNLLWSSYLGGDGEEEVVDVFVNESTGIQYVIGKTNSSNFYSTNAEIGSATTGFKTFVMAINPDASLAWSTLINVWDDPHAIHMDLDGNLTLVGVTENPILPGPAGLPGYDKDHNGGKDILILKMDNAGQNIVYSSYFGGSGDDTNQYELGSSEFRNIKAEFYGSKIYVVGASSSNDLPLTNEFDNNPGEAFAFVMDAKLSSSILEFSSYIKYDDGGITPMIDGGFALVINNGNSDYSGLISSNAIESNYDGFYTLPILLVFKADYTVQYATYIGPHRVEGDSQNCDNPAFNGTPGVSNLFEYELKSDNCGNIYWYSQSAGFRQPFVSSEFLLPARKYRPSLNDIDDLCAIGANNPLLKINMNDEANPFIEYMLFFGYGGVGSSETSFDIDDSGRLHIVSRQDIYNVDPNIILPPNAGNAEDLYFIFENDLSDVEVKQIGTGQFASPVLPTDIKVYDNKAYIFGTMTDVLSSVTPSWTDEDGNTNTIIQSSYGSGLTDGFISVIDNNELCEGCQESTDTTECNNVVLNFDGIDDRVTSATPLSGDSDYTISVDFNWSGNSTGSYTRLIGFTDYMTEIGISPSGELAFYNRTWRDSGITISPGQWYNVVLRRNGSDYKLFLNTGESYNAPLSSAVLNLDGALYIGSNYLGGEVWSGSMDNVRVYSTALTDAQILSGFSNVGTTYLLFNFEEGNPGSDNTNIPGPGGLFGIIQGVFWNLSLMGEASNYICDEYVIDFLDPCLNDSNPPMVACPLDGGTFSLNNQMIFNPSASDFDITATDECKIRYEFSPSQFTCDDLGDNVVTVIISDQSENSESCVIPFILNDNGNFCDPCLNDTTPPEVICPIDFIEVELGPDGTATITQDMFGIAATDNCGEVTLTGGNTTVACVTDLGVLTYLEITATDEAGLSTTCEVGFLTTDPNNYCDPCTNDTLNPIFNCTFQMPNFELGQDGSATMDLTWLSDFTTDNCGEVTISPTSYTVTCNDLLEPNDPIRFITVTATDESGNTDQCQIAIVVTDPNGFCDPCTNDTTPPICNSIDINLSLDDMGMATLTSNMIDDGSFDECSEVTFEIDIDKFDCDDIGPNVVTLTVFDLLENPSSCTSIVTIEDKINFCDPCCQSSDDFDAAVAEGLQINRDACLVSFEANNFEDCTQLTTTFPDGQTMSFNGGALLEYNFEEDGEFEICFDIIQQSTSGSSCNEATYCIDLCISCHEACEQDEFKYVVGSAFTHPDVQINGGINKYTSVFLKGADCYSGASVSNAAGNDPNITIWKNGAEILKFSGDLNDEVSEIFVDDNGDIYIMGSFHSPELSLPGTTTRLTKDANYPATSDAFITKYNANYGFIWAFSFGSGWQDDVEDFVQISETEFAIVGSTRISVDFDGDPNRELFSGSHNSVKSYVAKYTEIDNQIPKCDWVNTFHIGSEINGYTSCLGIAINHGDDSDNAIYVTGDYIGCRAGDPDGCETSEDFLYISGIATTLTVPQTDFWNGYIAKFDDIGGLINVAEHCAQIPDNVPGYLNDIEIYDNRIYGVGDKSIAEFDLNLGLINCEYLPVTNFDELAINSEGRIFAIGNDHSAFANLSMYDLSLNLIKTINPGNGERNSAGLSISESEGIIAITGRFNNDFFYPDYPNSTAYPIGLESTIGGHDFFVAKYECVCDEQMTEDCCDNINSIIKEDTNNQFCCTLSLDNEYGFDIVGVGIELIESNNDIQFDIANTEVDAEYTINSITTQSIEVSHVSGAIPAGNLNSILNYCLYNPDAVNSSDQTFVISYYENWENESVVVCRDTIMADCDQNLTEPCDNIINIETACIADNPNVFELTIEVQNNSGFDILSEVNLHSLPLGYSWMPCDIIPPIINVEYDISLNELAMGESTIFCIQIYADRPIFDNTDIEFNASFFDDKGSSVCVGNAFEINLQPCCDPCEDIQVSLEETKPCCYSLNLDNFCKSGLYSGMFISTVDASNKIGDVSFPNSEWERCRSIKSGLCLVNTNGFINDMLHSNVVNFCISGDNVNNPEISVGFFETHSFFSTNIECERFITTSCDGSCVSEGFTDPKLVASGTDWQQLSLQCDAPPFILGCPEIDNVWLKGKFDCAQDCKGEINVDVIINGKEIPNLGSYDDFGTWEIFLNSFLTEAGLYEILVTGTCDGEISICKYSFIIEEDCFECSCKDLISDLELGLDVSYIAKCERGFLPNGVTDCDIVNWSVDGVDFEITVGNKPFDFRFEGGSGSYDICYEITRDDGFEMCKQANCIKYTLDCGGDDLPFYKCESGNNENGDFSTGVKGSIHDNENAMIPNWELKSGEVWFYDKGGSLDTSSGYAELLTRDIENSIISTAVSNNNITQGDSNLVIVSYDVRSNTPHTYNIYLVSDTNRIIIDASCDPCTSHENIWESKLRTAPIDTQSIDFKDAFLSIELIGQENTYQNLQIDNVCIEIESTMVNTINLIDSNIHIYPNPTSDILHIQFDHSKFESLVVYDLNGRILIEETLDINTISHSLQTEDLSSGVYFIRFINEEGSVGYKEFVKID